MKFSVESTNAADFHRQLRFAVAISHSMCQRPAFIAGADAISVAEQKVAELQAQLNAYRDLSIAMSHDTK